VLHPRGTVTLSRTASVGFPVIMGRDMATSQDYFTWTCSEELEPRFLLMYLRARHKDLVGGLAMGSTHKTIYMADIQGLRVPLPPISEQRRIADFLDQEIQHLALMDRALQRLTNLASQRFETQVQSAVLGSPKHSLRALDQENPFAWFARTVRDDLRPRRLKLVLERNESGVWGQEPSGADDDVPVLRSTEISRDGSWRIGMLARRSLGKAQRQQTALVRGDIVVVTSSGSADHLGKSALVDDAVAGLGASFSNFLQRLRCGPGASPRFVWYLLNTSAARAQMGWLGSTTTGLRNLNGRILGDVLHSGMSPEEQAEVAYTLDREKEVLDRLQASAKRQRQLLAERHDALITAAVTGQLDPTSYRASAVMT
ncbi:MAG: restriction endonuclease subunit S, partial [Actinobacteria bacterium]|nr:restriction endonuclease subunit S [Actinomycetota bacterium]